MRLSRRKFINLSVRSSPVFVLGIQVFSCSDQKESNSFPAPVGDFERPFLKILEDGQIVLIAPVPDMGQGVRTSLPKLVAEELNSDLTVFTIEQGVAGNELGGMAAAGSDSISDYFVLLRKAGATVREMLMTAAATHWKVNRAEVKIVEGTAVHGKKEAPWFKLIPYLKEIPAPNDPPLKSKNDFELIGRSTKNADAKDIVSGKAQYGMDVRLPGMLYATVARCPVYGGKVKRYDAEKTLKVTGVLQVVEVSPLLPGGDKYAEILGGVAVVATDTWAAIKGRNSLEIEWDLASQQLLDNDDLVDQPLSSSQVLREEKNSENRKKDLQTREASYYLPPMAHACMEPMNFTASIALDGATLVGPTQNPRYIQNYISGIFKLPNEKVKVVPTLVGGGFGRRLAIDYALEAAIISKRVEKPIQLVWTREDDMRHDYFRTAAHHRLKASFDKERIINWEHEIYTQPIGDGPIYEVQGGADIPLDIPNIRISWGKLQSAVRIGSWRSVSHSHNSYVVNCWLDEIAREMDRDPVELLLDVIGSGDENVAVKLPLRGRRGNVITNKGRLKNVIQKVVAISNWSDELPANEGRGIAFAIYKNSYSAVVAQVKVDENTVLVEHVYSVLDCGLAVDPDGIKAQMTGSIMDGISTVFFNEITYTNSKIDQTNFHQLQWARNVHVPEMHLEIVSSDHNPNGAGEPPYPAVAPAIANAIFDACGVRLRRLPASHFGLEIRSRK